MMKELLAESSLKEGKATEWFTIHNLVGAPKKFRQTDGFWDKPTEAKAWMKSRDFHTRKVDPDERARKKRDAEFDKLDRAAMKPWAREKLNLQTVYDKVIDSIGSSFPDGDPIDNIAPWLKRKGIDGYEIGETVEAALKKHGRGVEKKGMYAYMASMWDEMGKDALYDAETMMKKGEEYDSPLISYNKGKPEIKDNPWK